MSITDNPTRNPALPIHHTRHPPQIPRQNNTIQRHPPITESINNRKSKPTHSNPLRIHTTPLHPPLITQNPIPNYNLPMTKNPQPHQPTLTIDTYQPPDPTKPQHRMARPIITPQSSHNQRLRPPKQLLHHRQRDRRTPTHRRDRL